MIVRAALVLLVLLALPCWARLGGGQSYSGGGSSSSHGGGGGGEIIELLLEVIIRLIFYYPAIGIPLLVVFCIGAFYVYSQNAGQRAFQESQDWSNQVTPMRVASSPVTQLRSLDPNFSRPIFLDFMALLYTRVRTESTTDMGGLKAYLAPDLLDRLRKAAAYQQLKSVDQVIVGSVRLVGANATGPRTILTVSLETNYRRTKADGQTEDLYCVEDWTLERQTGVLSKGPDEALKLACPSCGNPGEMAPDGTCSYCGNKVNTGRFNWVVTRISVRQEIPKLNLALGDEGEEVGTDLPTRYAPGLEPERKAFEARDPAFVWEAFEERVSHVFLTLQKAWSDRQEEQIRPYETDSLFSTHRYWIEAYRQQGLKNCLEEVGLDRIELARVEPDAFYESLTVRVWAHMKDSTVEEKSGRVVSGNPKVMRRFSEYWTFIRRIGAKKGSEAVDRCPSCGAPLDQIGMTGICGYCDSKVTRGDFDWVLSLIEQDEAYQA